MRILIDTNIYSDAMHDNQDAVYVLKHAASIFLSPIVIGELLYGFKGGNREPKNRAQLTCFLESPRVSIVDITSNTSEYFALIIFQLRSTGTPIPSNDIWIAASALEHGLKLVSRDAHFRNIEGLLLWETGK